jgi:glutamate synthase domain-containing protein 1
MRSLESAIRDVVESAMDSAIPEPWEVSQKAASAIMKAIRDRLLSDEAVEAGARAYTADACEKAVMAGTLTYRGSYREAVENTVEMTWAKYSGEAKKVLSAALDRIETHDR